MTSGCRITHPLWRCELLDLENIAIFLKFGRLRLWSLCENLKSARVCRARLQAGTLESMRCPPEGGLYMNENRFGFPTGGGPEDRPREEYGASPPASLSLRRPWRAPVAVGQSRRSFRGVLWRSEGKTICLCPRRAGWLVHSSRGCSRNIPSQKPS